MRMRPSFGSTWKSSSLNAVAPPASGLVQIDHRGPGALAAVRLIFRPIGLVDVEEVGMLAEALALLVALALERLAVGAVDAEQVGDPRFDLGDQRVVDVEVAAVAGADVFVLLLVVERRGVAALVDLLAHLAAGLGVEEAVADVELDRLLAARAQPPQAAASRPACRRPAADPGAQLRPLLRERNRRLVIGWRFGVGHGAICLRLARLPIGARKPCRAKETLVPLSSLHLNNGSLRRVARSMLKVIGTALLTAVRDQHVLDLVLQFRAAAAARGRAQRHRRHGQAGERAAGRSRRSRSQVAPSGLALPVVGVKADQLIDTFDAARAAAGGVMTPSTSWPPRARR